WGIRHLIVIFTPYALLSVLALNRLRPQMLKISAYALLCTLVVLGCVLHFRRPAPTYIWCGWEDLSKQALEQDAEKAPVIYAFEDLVAYHLWFATKNSDRRVQIVSIKDYPEMIEDKAYFLPRGFSEIRVGDQTALEGKRFWLAFRETNWKPEHPLIRDLTAKGYRFGKPLEFEAQGLTAFLVLVEKE
ncbi:MAG TPA: hypothetical protein VEX64_03555, partial [Pyrinomonadaceae bacterium]|nr:hypothetical protein [Pyrinomonadaceae bacterium]